MENRASDPVPHLSSLQHHDTNVPRSPQSLVYDRLHKYTRHNVCMIIHQATDWFPGGFLEDKCTWPRGGLAKRKQSANTCFDWQVDTRVKTLEKNTQMSTSLCVPSYLFWICSVGLLNELTHWCSFTPELLGSVCPGPVTILRLCQARLGPWSSICVYVCVFFQ